MKFRCNGPATAWLWDFGDGTTSTQAAPTHRFEPGRYRVHLIGLDASSCVGTDSVQVVVTKPPWTPPLCRATVAPSAGTAPLSTVFSAFYVEPNPGGTITQARWTFTDGSTSDELVVPRIFDLPGVTSASLRVEDDHGLSCTDSVHVTVLTSKGELPPRILASPPLQAECGQLYQYVPLASGTRPIGWKLREGPGEMVVDSGTGKVTWTPAGHSRTPHVTLVATNGAGEATQDFDVAVVRD